MYRRSYYFVVNTEKFQLNLMIYFVTRFCVLFCKKELIKLELHPETGSDTEFAQKARELTFTLYLRVHICEKFSRTTSLVPPENLHFIALKANSE